MGASGGCRTQKVQAAQTGGSLLREATGAARMSPERAAVVVRLHFRDVPERAAEALVTERAVKALQALRVCGCAACSAGRGLVKGLRA